MVVAADRAGALGLLDLVAAPADQDVLSRALRRIDRLGTRSFGVRLDAGAIATARPGSWPEGLAVVVAVEETGADWTAILNAIRETGRIALAEVTSNAGAEAALAAGADGVIVAGHEAGGRCASLSSFVMLQGVLSSGNPRAWVRGGIGPRSACACMAMGAAGVVLDGAVLLARESPLVEEVRARIARFDGGETTVLGTEGGTLLRVFDVPATAVEGRSRADAVDGRRVEAADVGWSVRQSWPVGQDAALAGELARRHVTVGGIVRAAEEAIDRGLERAGRSDRSPRTRRWPSRTGRATRSCRGR